MKKRKKYTIILIVLFVSGFSYFSLQNKKYINSRKCNKLFIDAEKNMATCDGTNIKLNELIGVKKDKLAEIKKKNRLNKYLKGKVVVTYKNENKYSLKSLIVKVNNDSVFKSMKV